MNRQVKIIGLLSCLLFTAFTVCAQTSTLPLGHWQLHVPNNLAKAVAVTPDKVYCATEHGFFYYDKEFNQLKSLSKTDGFSDVNISTIGYDAASKILVVAYENTNIDLVADDGEIVNIPAILRKPITGEKLIHHIYFHNKLAYLACSFGVVVLDLVKHEIKETYSNLGAGGSQLAIYSNTILNDSIYITSDAGILVARRSNTNLLDFRNWKTFTTAQGLPFANNRNFRTIATFHNKVFAGVNQSGLYQYNGQLWRPISINYQNTDFQQLIGYPEYLVITDDQKIRVLDKNGSVTTRDAPVLNNLRAALPDQEIDGFWVADYGNGLVKVTAAGAENFFPSGPLYNNPFRVYSDNKSTFILGGGYTPTYSPQQAATGFSEYVNGEWLNFNRQLYPNQFPTVLDLVAAVRNPVNNKLYLASYGYGLVEWEGLDKYKIFNSSNSPLVSNSQSSPGQTFIAGLATDKEGNIWVTNRHPEVPNGPGLHVLRPDATWQSFALPGFADAANLGNLVIDANGYKWIIISKTSGSNRGIVVFDEGTSRFRHLTTQPGQGGLPSQNINALVVDKNNQVWVATDKGVTVFYEPDLVFAGSNFNSSIPIIDRRPLLENQVIRALAVDGANRKWVGTDTGLWLFNEDANQVIQFFNTENSPLPSDKIIDISINQQTGEVFIITDAGLISYLGTATETEGKPACATVFPNPVRPGYTGLVGLAGLPNQAIVKITDITGALVYQTKAQGGTVAWDLHDLKGRRVKGGVYLAYSSTSDGSQQCISKIAVID